jgi:hypothetical protein
MRKLRFRCYTLIVTNVKTGWTIHFARLNKAATGVLKVLDKALTAFPQGLTGIHSDTGSECINRPVNPWCQRHGGPCSRGRPTHKHDKCYVAQKKYATVRKTVGYFRYQGVAGGNCPPRRL